MTEDAGVGHVIGLEVSQETLLERKATKIDLKKRKAELLAMIKRQSEENARMETNFARGNNGQALDQKKEEQIKNLSE